MKKTTIHEIAKSLGIDGSTVSRALNGSSLVKKETKELILKTAKEMGYKRNLMASNLRRNRSNTIGVVVPKISRYFFSSTIAGIEETAYAAGFNVVICQSLEELERERGIIDNLLENRVDGILISVSMETNEGSHLIHSVDNGTPVVFFDRHLESLHQIGKVLIDDFLGGFQATEHLILQGCKRIAHFSGPQELEIYKNRLKGYRSALEKYGLSYVEDMVFSSMLSEDDGHNLAQRTLEEKPSFDGIFCANDLSAVGAMKFFKKEGVSIPGEIAIVGFSNDPISQVIEPSLTTIDQSGGDIGRSACDMLLKIILEEDSSVHSKTFIFSPKLIVRESSKRK